MILSCHQISLSYGIEVILDNVSFHIEEHEKAAITGINGAGKSTLLDIISGLLSPDSGEVTIAKGKTLGYLQQYQEFDADLTIYESLLQIRQDVLSIYDKLRRLEQDMKTAQGSRLEEMLASYDRLNHRFEQENGYAVQSEVTGILKGLGFAESEFSKKLSSLSGGQKTRVSLGRILLKKPDIILLDEPTNHLDLHSIAWLEGFLQNYPGTVVIVAHDRYFLDKVVTKVIEIENHHARMYRGNYTAFADKKKQLREEQLRAWMNQQQEIRHQQAVIEKLRSFNREKSIKRAESREKMLEKIVPVDKPLQIDEYMHLSLTPDVQSGNEVMHIEDLSKGFGNQMLFRQIRMDIRRGEKVALIGDNGTGKTTILKIINRIIPPDTGLIRLGSNVHIGYYDQEQHNLDPEKSIFDEISDSWPSMDRTRIRSVLAAFLFTGDDVFKRIGDLSGGERARVSLAKLMLSDANFLILDEPTNHLDIASREILENAVAAYSGTVLYVSHDRYFINRTGTRILELSENGLAGYEGNYDYYLEKKDTPSFSSSSGVSVTEQTAGKGSASSAKLDYHQQKQEQARKRKLENQIKKTEARIDEIDTRLAEIDELLTQEEIYTDPEKLLPLTKEREALDEEQLSMMQTWEDLQMQQEEDS